MVNHDLGANGTAIWSPHQDSFKVPLPYHKRDKNPQGTIFLTHACSSFGWCKFRVIIWVHKRAVRPIKNTFKILQQWSYKIKQTLEHHAIRCERVYSTKGQGHVFSNSVLNHKPGHPSSHAWTKWKNLRKNVATNALPPFAETSQKHLFGWPVCTGLHFWERYAPGKLMRGNGKK